MKLPFARIEGSCPDGPFLPFFVTRLRSAEASGGQMENCETRMGENVRREITGEEPALLPFSCFAYFVLS
jgi:hypothetical protein